MYRFFLDAVASVRFRFFASTHYRYSVFTVLAILLTICLVNVALFHNNEIYVLVIKPALNVDYAMDLFLALVIILKWLLLSLTMGIFLRKSGQPAINWLGFILITMALTNLPMILLLYWPQQLTVINLCWQIWIMCIQFFGFMRISQQSGFKIVGAYLVYTLLTSISILGLVSLFGLIGWIDIPLIKQGLEQFIATHPM